jgi:hypothetical protein
VHRHDVRVLEGHREFRLSDEAGAEALVERKVGRHELQRHRALQSQVVGTVDDAHAAPPDQLLDPVAEEVGSDLNLGVDSHGVILEGTIRLLAPTIQRAHGR